MDIIILMNSKLYPTVTIQNIWDITIVVTVSLR